jgi:geranylgeranyl reductase family protein
MDSCDVLIVGGGPAGSTLAWRLRSSGLDVVILDKSVFPRDKVCAGWITPSTVQLLQLDVGEYGRDRVLQPIRGFKTGMIGGDEVVTRYDQTVSYGIRRSEFDHYLLLRSGARLRLGEPFRTMERKNGAWIVNGTVKTPLVIGAGGHFCPVARALRWNGKLSAPVVIAQEAEFEMDGPRQRECRVAADTPELYFCEDLKGYGWCIRKGNFLNIGLGREDNHEVADAVRSFVAYLYGKKRIPVPVPAQFKGHAYLLYQGPSRDLADDNVMLIGDAAGLASPKSGEGIGPAVESAVAASDVILSAAGDYRCERLQRYPVQLASRLGTGGTIRSILPLPLKEAISRRLLENKWFSRHVLLDRWFLHADRFTAS